MNSLNDFIINFKYAFRPHKPLLVRRLAEAVIKSCLFRKPPLRYVDFALDFTCNLKCRHCFAVSLKQEGRKKLNINDYLSVAGQCMELGTVNFSFQGGEPLLLANLEEVISAFKPQRNLISVTTNGTLLTKDKIIELKKIGVDILTVSLDSSIAQEHDDFRGVNGSFEKAYNGIRFALRNGLKVTLGCVVTHQTLRTKGFLGLLEIAQQLKTVLCLIFPVNAGRWKRQEQILLDEQDLLYIRHLTRSSLYIRTDFQANLGGYGCGAVKEILYITPYGDVLACPFLHFSLGNVLEEPLSTIRNRALKSKYFASYYNKCLASTDKVFREKYLNKTIGSDKLPLPWNEAL